MSFSPVLSPINIFQRLEQLRKWQESHDSLLSKTKNLINTTTGSDYQTIEGLSEFDSTLPERNEVVDVEAQIISPAKPFAQLLEEKLAEDVEPRDAPAKPKRPFLRKGSGLRRFGLPPRTMTPLRAPDVSIRPKATWCKVDPPGDQTLYEKALEKELAIFEALEERAENSSFCSTNSSVLRIMASTPSKVKPSEEKHVHWESDDVARLLLRFQHLQSSDTDSTTSDDTSVSSSDLDSTMTSRCRDVAVGPDDDDAHRREYERRLDDVLQDKNRVAELRRQLEAKERDLEKRTREFEEQKRELLHELDVQRKNLAKERQVFQSCNAQKSRPNKAEVSNLKQELADLSETMKMKESKNGMTQARLRNSIKQLEKENRELKEQVERLTKDNAKLAASQKLNRRSTDAKILKRINDNVTKLTEEALKAANTKKVDDLLEPQVPEAPKPPTPSDKTERLLEDGSRQVTYASGNVKTVSPDGNFITVTYFNGDKQETNLLDGSVKYRFFSNICQTTFADGLELIEYPDGVTERRRVDGTCEVTLPDGVVQTTFADGVQETRYTDGSVVRMETNGEKVLYLPNGQKEVETKEYKRREYPDGTVKILHRDGTLETKYANGRVRIKDGNGTLLVDTRM